MKDDDKTQSTACCSGGLSQLVKSGENLPAFLSVCSSLLLVLLAVIMLLQIVHYNRRMDIAAHEHHQELGVIRARLGLLEGQIEDLKQQRGNVPQLTDSDSPESDKSKE